MDIVGHEKTISFLKKSMANDLLSHCYIFCGPNNIGKTTVAKWFASELLKTDPARSPNFFEIKSGENSISKEESDNVTGKLAMSAWGGGYKVLIVESAHLMTVSAANAFLKTLEEPPKKTIVILLTSELGKILPTIISRAVVLRFAPVDKNDLRKLAAAKNIQEPKKYINLSFGRPGKMADLLENDSWQAEEKENLAEFYNLFFGSGAARLKTAAAVFKNKDGQKAKIFKKIDFWTELVRDIFLVKYKLHDNVAHSLNGKMLEEIAERGTINYFSNLAGRLIKMRGLIKNNINTQLMLENLII